MLLYSKYSFNIVLVISWSNLMVKFVENIKKWFIAESVSWKVTTLFFKFLFTILIFSLLFALIYLYVLPQNYFSIKGEIRSFECFWESFYFSLVTVTTLGYGDIYPVRFASRLIVVLEPIVGLFIIGWMLSEFHKKHSDIIIKNIDLKKVIDSKDLITRSLTDFRESIRDLRTDGNFLGEDDRIKKFKSLESYEVSDLISIYDPSNLDDYFGLKKILAYEMASKILREHIFSYIMLYNFDSTLQGKLSELLSSMSFNPTPFKTILANSSGKGDDWTSISSLTSQIKRIDINTCFGKFDNPVCSLYKRTKKQEELINELLEIINGLKLKP